MNWQYIRQRMDYESRICRNEQCDNCYGFLIQICYGCRLRSMATAIAMDNLAKCLHAAAVEYARECCLMLKIYGWAQQTNS
jgi:hypothetical protein